MTAAKLLRRMEGIRVLLPLSKFIWIQRVQGGDRIKHFEHQPISVEPIAESNTGQGSSMILVNNGQFLSNLLT